MKNENEMVEPVVLPETNREYTVSMTVTFDIVIDVEATNEEEAEYNAKEKFMCGDFDVESDVEFSSELVEDRSM